jgi:hypothetical protein
MACNFNGKNTTVTRMIRLLHLFLLSVSVCLSGAAAADPAASPKILGADSCATSGCHGGAGPNRGAHTLWKNYDPHNASAATLSNGRSKAMAAQLGLADAAEAQSCTTCHAPNRGLDRSLFAQPAQREEEIKSVSCTNCHGAAENWILSHTRPEFPREALAHLGMRQLGSAYQRANNCVGCHQNLSDELVAAKHPPLVFELDGLLVAEPKHWREDKGFSSTQTWLVGQAVALREAAALAAKEPGDRRTAEIEALKELLRGCGASFAGTGQALVAEADAYAQRVSAEPIEPGQARAILAKLVHKREPFLADGFVAVAKDYRMWAAGHYAERLALAIDRLNQALGKTIPAAPINELFDAAKPPKAFDAEICAAFVRKLEVVAKSLPSAP